MWVVVLGGVGGDGGDGVWLEWWWVVLVMPLPDFSRLKDPLLTGCQCNKRSNVGLVCQSDMGRPYYSVIFSNYLVILLLTPPPLRGE